MKIQITALTSFSHGALDAHQGQTYSINKGDADELAKLGFVKLVVQPDEDAETVAEKPASADQPEAAIEPPAAKMDDVPKNKMDAPAANKASKAKAK